MIYNQIVTWKSFAIIAMFFIGILFFLVTKSYFDNYKNCQSDLYWGGVAISELECVAQFCCWILFFMVPNQILLRKLWVWSGVWGSTFLLDFACFGPNQKNVAKMWV